MKKRTIDSFFTRQSSSSNVENIVDSAPATSPPVSLTPNIEQPSIDSEQRPSKTARVDLFNACIDFQLSELQSRFCENVTELLLLTSALNPRDEFKLFKVEDICKLASKFYSADFTDVELSYLKYELDHFKIDVLTRNDLKQISTISELCKVLQETKRCEIYPLFDRLIRLVLTLPVSTVTTKRAFSAMKIVKTRLRNKMEDDFLADSLVISIEREIARTFDIDSIIDAFDLKKKRRVPLRMPKNLK